MSVRTHAHNKNLNPSNWCKKFQVEPLASMEELVEKSDYIIELSPDHPEHHEKLARIPLMSDKPVYVDKIFSPDLKSGMRMFELAGQFRTPMFSSSALRFAKELAGYPDAKVNRESLELWRHWAPELMRTIRSTSWRWMKKGCHCERTSP